MSRVPEIARRDPYRLPVSAIVFGERTVYVRSDGMLLTDVCSTEYFLIQQAILRLLREKNGAGICHK